MTNTSPLHTDELTASQNAANSSNLPQDEAASAGNNNLATPPSATTTFHSDLADSHVGATPVEATEVPQNEDSEAVSTDPRHQHRQVLMQHIFAYSFQEQDLNLPPEQAQQVGEDLTPEQQETLTQLITDLPNLDAAIQTAAPERPLREINKVDLAILRLVMFESKQKKTPKKVLINEAIELAKEFGTESSSRFINGALAQLFSI